jgi:hypothetical protein
LNAPECAIQKFVPEFFSAACETDAGFSLAAIGASWSGVDDPKKSTTLIFRILLGTWSAAAPQSIAHQDSHERRDPAGSPKIG